jgi:hypothetical protein
MVVAAVAVVTNSFVSRARYACGFGELIPSLRDQESDEISTQLDVFEEEAADDWAEMVHRFRNVQFNMSDEVDTTVFLRCQLQGTKAAPYVLRPRLARVRL